MEEAWDGDSPRPLDIFDTPLAFEDDLSDVDMREERS